METSIDKLVRDAPLPLRMPIRRASAAWKRFVGEHANAVLTTHNHPDRAGARLTNQLALLQRRIDLVNVLVDKAVRKWRTNRMSNESLGRLARRWVRTSDHLQRRLDRVWIGFSLTVPKPSAEQLALARRGVKDESAAPTVVTAPRVARKRTTKKKLGRFWYLLGRAAQEGVSSRPRR